EDGEVYVGQTRLENGESYADAAQRRLSEHIRKPAEHLSGWFNNCSVSVIRHGNVHSQNQLDDIEAFEINQGPCVNKMKVEKKSKIDVAVVTQKVAAAVEKVVSEVEKENEKTYWKNVPAGNSEDAALHVKYANDRRWKANATFVEVTLN